MKFQVCLVFFLVSMAIQLSAGNVDSTNSHISFEITKMKKHIVTGTISGMRGDVFFDSTDFSESILSVCIDPATVLTDNKTRDNHLRGDDYFDVENYPEICFESDSIFKTDDSFFAKGRLSMHGITHEVEIPFNFKKNCISGSFTVNRKDYEIGPKSKFSVGEEVTITIFCFLN